MRSSYVVPTLCLGACYPVLPGPSALHMFKGQNPTDAAHPDGLLEVRFLKVLMDAAQAGGLPDEVEVEWLVVAMVLAHCAI